MTKINNALVPMESSGGEKNVFWMQIHPWLQGVDLLHIHPWKCIIFIRLCQYDTFIGLYISAGKKPAPNYIYWNIFGMDIW